MTIMDLAAAARVAALAARTSGDGLTPAKIAALRADAELGRAIAPERDELGQWVELALVAYEGKADPLADPRETRARHYRECIQWLTDQGVLDRRDQAVVAYLVTAADHARGL